jgi:hypothetical protein
MFIFKRQRSALCVCKSAIMTWFRVLKKVDLLILISHFEQASCMVGRSYFSAILLSNILRRRNRTILEVEGMKKGCPNFFLFQRLDISSIIDYLSHSIRHIYLRILAIDLQIQRWKNIPKDLTELFCFHSRHWLPQNGFREDRWCKVCQTHERQRIYETEWNYHLSVKTPKRSSPSGLRGRWWEVNWLGAGNLSQVPNGTMMMNQY